MDGFAFLIALETRRVFQGMLMSLGTLSLEETHA